jgi:hypothetical protein
VTSTVALAALGAASSHRLWRRSECGPKATDRSVLLAQQVGELDVLTNEAGDQGLVGGRSLTALDAVGERERLLTRDDRRLSTHPHHVLPRSASPAGDPSAGRDESFSALSHSCRTGTLDQRQE